MGFFYTLVFWQIGSARKIALVLKKVHFKFDVFSRFAGSVCSIKLSVHSHFFGENDQIKNFFFAYQS